MGTESSLPPAGNDQIICTLYEGDYHLGVGALINSIVKAGYEGLFWVGYRGALPPWLGQLPQRPDGLYQVGKALLGFEFIESSTHFTQYKPEFLRSILDRGMASGKLWYFDPDITVRCDWNFYERWVSFGVCLCQEITMGFMPSNHPIRCEWMELFRKEGWSDPVHRLNVYYNGGFVGLQIEHRSFVDTWRNALQVANSSGLPHDLIQHGTRQDIFFSTDQDALNIAAMYAPVPLTTIGPEGMGFMSGGFTMYHSVAGNKPWRKRFLRLALAGHPPSNGDRHFLACAAGPIQLYTPGGLKRKRLTVLCASLIGRFYSRHSK